MAEPQIPDFTISAEAIRAIEALQHEHRQVRMVDAFRALVELRRRHAGFLTRVVAFVDVPQCEDCYAVLLP